MLIWMRSFILSVFILPRTIGIAGVWLITLYLKYSHSYPVLCNGPVLARNVPFLEKTGKGGNMGKFSK